MQHFRVSTAEEEVVQDVENHAPNVGGQVRGGEGYKRAGNNYKNSYYI